MPEEQNIAAEISEEGMTGEQSSDDVSEDVPRNVPLTGPDEIYPRLPDFTDDEEDDVPQNNAVERGRDMPSLSDDEFEDDALAGEIPSDDEWVSDDSDSLAQGGGAEADVEDDEGDEGEVHDFEIDVYPDDEIDADDIEDSEHSESSSEDEYFHVIEIIPCHCPVHQAGLQTYPYTCVPLVPFFENTPDSSAESN